MIKSSKNTEKIVRLYKKSKINLNLPPEYLKAFEYRYGLFDGKLYTHKEISERLGISNSRSGQLLARMKYELKKRYEELTPSRKS